jgi:metal-sulfur cluster biosynthetic enzyme
MNTHERFAAAAAGLDAAAPAPNAAPDAAGPDPERVWAALGTVIDPELGLDLVTLGMIYGVEVGQGGAVRVTFTLTIPGCPMEQVITGGVVNAVGRVPGVEEVEPVLVWEPEWNPGMIREGAW